MSADAMSLVWDLNVSPEEKILLMALADDCGTEAYEVRLSLPSAARKAGIERHRAWVLHRRFVIMGLVMRMNEEGTIARLTLRPQ